MLLAKDGEAFPPTLVALTPRRHDTYEEGRRGKAVEQFIQQAVSQFGISDDQARSATGGVLGLEKR